MDRAWENEANFVNGPLLWTEPGTISFDERGILVKESVQVAQVAVSRKNGADGEVSINWRTIDKTAVNGKDYQGGEGVLVFKHAEVELRRGRC